jgi:hypothetical protein
MVVITGFRLEVIGKRSKINLRHKVQGGWHNNWIYDALKIITH